LGASVKHTYAEVGDTRTMLNGDVRLPTKSRYDGFKCKVENDLTANGLYKFLMDNDLTDQTIEYVPNTVGAAKWSGTVKVTLPDEIGADEFGKPIISEPEWDASGGTGKFTFTAGT
jgi:hypothetical protein